MDSFLKVLVSCFGICLKVEVESGMLFLSMSDAAPKLLGLSLAPGFDLPRPRVLTSLQVKRKESAIRLCMLYLHESGCEPNGYPV
jgi:hypothetical protein